MALDFSQFDTRRYPMLAVRDGYGQWAPTYEQTVPDELDWRLLDRVKTVPWNRIERAVDLGCGTGRTGAWLRAHGIKRMDGIDITPEMLVSARHRNIYESLGCGDILATKLDGGAYDLAITCLVDEHLKDLGPLYGEVARLVRDSGWFVLVGYHPFFSMGGVPTHFDDAEGRPTSVEMHVHLLSDHVTAALANSWSLVEMHEGLIDEAWILKKPKWGVYRNRPISFVAVWRK